MNNFGKLGDESKEQGIVLGDENNQLKATCPHCDEKVNIVVIEGNKCDCSYCHKKFFVQAFVVAASDEEELKFTLGVVNITLKKVFEHIKTLKLKKEFEE